MPPASTVIRMRTVFPPGGCPPPRPPKHGGVPPPYPPPRGLRPRDGACGAEYVPLWLPFLVRYPRAWEGFARDAPCCHASVVIWLRVEVFLRTYHASWTTRGQIARSSLDLKRDTRV